jgi:lysozyme
MGIAINIHRGGYRTTSSEGCQTIYPSQWDGFINLVYSEMSRYNQKTIPYLLVENA